MDIGYSCRFAWSLLRVSPVPFLQAQRIRVQDGADGLELIIDETFGKQTNVNVNKGIYNWMLFTGWFIWNSYYIYRIFFSVSNNNDSHDTNDDDNDDNEYVLYMYTYTFIYIYRW